MRVALVHDDLVQWGGAERVLYALTELFPNAPIYTSVFDRSNKRLHNLFKDKDIRTSFMQKIPGWKYLYKSLMPVYPIAFEQFDFSNFDLVVSHTTRFAKCIITKPETKHVSLMHTPPRFLWNYSGVTYNKFLNFLFGFLRILDRISAIRVDEIISCSNNAQKRVRKNYDVETKVIQPFVEKERFLNKDPFNGGYYLIISRLNDYKKIDLAINVFNKNGNRLRIVGKGPMEERLKEMAQENIDFLGNVSEKLLNEVILGCKAMIILAEEDFGLTSLEAQAAGKGVIAYKKGGVLETVINGETGILFNEQTEKALEEALNKFEKSNFSKQKCMMNARNFSREKFVNPVISSMS
ncbi:MAG: Glycosyl transferase group 1 [Candidatus Daviesbacteria bacterium GW2011_GWB1_36_5]|uniref:Glycosyl transferase group 1 n=1 Tax=Candidatus Daviesbacteria bacterium GW2011_GWB1_36_5 TaxID=1618426 RepID=A0A0G0F5P7_9BACT|nr:MAG: Glycosyl transferase group 1 [Candidatus Daviesbacteria bacterium GW2011_GWB1_36_5]